MRAAAAVAVGTVLVVVVAVLLAKLARPDGVAALPSVPSAAPTTAPAMRTVRLHYYDPARDRDQTGNVMCSDKGLVAVEREIPSPTRSSRTPSACSSGAS